MCPVVRLQLLGLVELVLELWWSWLVDGVDTSQLVGPSVGMLVGTVAGGAVP